MAWSKASAIFADSLHEDPARNTFINWSTLQTLQQGYKQLLTDFPQLVSLFGLHERQLACREWARRPGIKITACKSFEGPSCQATRSTIRNICNTGCSRKLLGKVTPMRRSLSLKTRCRLSQSSLEIWLTSLPILCASRQPLLKLQESTAWTGAL